MKYPYEWLVDKYQLLMYRWGARYHGYKTGNYNTLDFHNKFTKRAERSIEKQNRRSRGRLFVDWTEERKYKNSRETTES